MTWVVGREGLEGDERGGQRRRQAKSDEGSRHRGRCTWRTGSPTREPKLGVEEVEPEFTVEGSLSMGFGGMTFNVGWR